MSSDEATLTQLVADACRVLAHRGLVDGILGHVSARVAEDRFLVRCRGPHERGLRRSSVEDVWPTDLDLSKDELPHGFGLPKEIHIHAALLRERPDAGAVVHAHPPAALLYGLADLELRPIFGAYNIPAMRMALDGVPVHPRAVLISRPELAEELLASMDGADVCVMRGHGIAVVGETVEQAVVRADNLNTLLRTTVELAHLGAQPPKLGEQDLAELPDLGSAFNDDFVWRALLAEVRAADDDDGSE